MTTNDLREQTTTWIGDEVEHWKQEARRAQAAIERVRALAADMRTWCSPHGIATVYADRIDEALDSAK